MDTSLIASEIAETESFLATATFSGIKASLEQHLAKLKRQLAAAEASNNPPPVAPSSSIPSSKLAATVSRLPELSYVPIESFAWDQGSYNSPTVSIFVDLVEVGTVKDQVDVKFTKHSFDLTVVGLNGRNYRLIKDNLEKDIIPEKSTFTVKKNKIVLKLQKVKGEYSYDHWAQLTAKKKRDETVEAKKDPSAGIMDMMKDMYDNGDENMKRIIGESMMKSQRGEKMEPPSLDSMNDL